MLRQIAETGKLITRQDRESLDEETEEAEPTSPSDDRGIWLPADAVPPLLDADGQSMLVEETWVRKLYNKFHLKEHPPPSSPTGLPPAWGWAEARGNAMASSTTMVEVEGMGEGKQEMEQDQVVMVAEQEDVDVPEEELHEEHVMIDIDGPSGSPLAGTPSRAMPPPPPAHNVLRVSRWQRMVSWVSDIIWGGRSLVAGRATESDVLQRRSKDSTAATDAWAWLKAHDELMLEMARGEVFFGFKEASIAFPPSFRWKPGTFAGAFDRVSEWLRIEPSRGSTYP